MRGPPPKKPRGLCRGPIRGEDGETGPKFYKGSIRRGGGNSKGARFGSELNKNRCRWQNLTPNIGFDIRRCWPLLWATLVRGTPRPGLLGHHRHPTYRPSGVVNPGAPKADSGRNRPVTAVSGTTWTKIGLTPAALSRFRASFGEHWPMWPRIDQIWPEAGICQI